MVTRGDAICSWICFLLQQHGWPPSHYDYWCSKRPCWPILSRSGRADVLCWCWQSSCSTTFPALQQKALHSYLVFMIHRDAGFSWFSAFSELQPWDLIIHHAATGRWGMGTALLLPGAVGWNSSAGAQLWPGEIPASCLSPLLKKPNPTANKKPIDKSFRLRSDLKLYQNLIPPFQMWSPGWWQKMLALQ